MQYEMGGKIGIETLLLNERLLLADFVTHEILAAAASERLRRDGDLMMDWVTTVELVCLHHAIYFHRFNDMDIMGQMFMDNVRVKLHTNLNQRLKELEKTIRQVLPSKDFLYPIEDYAAFAERTVAYEAAFHSRSDVEMAETLWSYLANAEVFELEDEEHEALYGAGKTKRIIDRHFNPEGIEFLVYYVRKNLKLFNDRSFYDYKLCANFVDTHSEKLLREQRLFREHALAFVHPQDEPLDSNRHQVEALLKYDYAQKNQMSFFERIGFKRYKPSNQLELEIDAMDEINQQKLEQYLVGKTQLDLFNQARSTWLFKSGRWTK